MTIARKMSVNGATIEVTRDKNSDPVTMTWTVYANQIMEDRRREQVTWTITWPGLTHDEVRCLEQQFGVCADRCALELMEEDEKFIIELPRVAANG